MSIMFKGNDIFWISPPDLSTWFLMGTYTEGIPPVIKGYYYAATFGLGGNQETYDTFTDTYSPNKDWLAQQLYNTGRLDTSWEQFFVQKGYNCSDCSILVDNGTYPTTTECQTGCAAPPTANGNDSSPLIMIAGVGLIMFISLNKK
jgi:hypothetical protein